ncbi:hypothetical protein, partial [Enterococcus faecalis]|uniref:hypothetical protein n=1 Tax=Enterococcus faecalis TaxID=1351 RepID=UPI001C658BB1
TFAAPPHPLKIIAEDFLSVGNIGFFHVEICLAYVLRVLLVVPHIALLHNSFLRDFYDISLTVL